MGNSLSFLRNVEVWIFGAFGGLVLGACLGGPPERAATAGAAVAAAPEAVAETGPAQAQPMYVVYVTARRLSTVEKRAARGQAG